MKDLNGWCKLTEENWNLLNKYGYTYKGAFNSWTMFEYSAYYNECSKFLISNGGFTWDNDEISIHEELNLKEELESKSITQ